MRARSLPWAIVAAAAALSAHAGDDWPQWRGPNRDGISRETGLRRSWPSDGPPLDWKAGGLGAGYSTVAVDSGRLFTLGADDEIEYVIALDAETGRELWRTRNGRRYRDRRGDGPRSAPTVDGTRLYALGGSGDLSALDVATGKKHWSLNLLSTFGARNIQWGISESPLVLEDRLLVNAGGRGASIVALSKSDGSVLWKSAADEAGYSSAVSATIAGVRQAVFFTGERVLGIDVADGRVLWQYRRVSNRTANVATPVVVGEHVFVSSDYGTGCALLRIEQSGDDWSANEVYFSREMKNHHASAVVVDGTIYGFSGRILKALDFRTGEVLWQDRSVGKGSLIYADGHLYVFSENGVMGLVRATRAGYQEVARFEIERSRRASWSHPVIANGRLYLRDQDALYRFDLRDSR